MSIQEDLLAAQLKVLEASSYTDFFMVGGTPRGNEQDKLKVKFADILLHDDFLVMALLKSGDESKSGGYTIFGFRSDLDIAKLRLRLNYQPAVYDRKKVLHFVRTLVIHQGNKKAH